MLVRPAQWTTQEDIAVAVTDGSFKDSIAMAQWTIQGPQHNFQHWTGAIAAPGRPGIQNAHRAESWGALAERR